MTRPCECSAPGFCPRHKVLKSESLYKRCKENDRFRELMDQKVAEAEAKEIPTIPSGGPSMPRKIFNFSKAMARASMRYLKDGSSKVTKEVYEKRLETCNDCEFRNVTRCTHMNCGCDLLKKARYVTEKCPIGKWDQK